MKGNFRRIYWNGIIYMRLDGGSLVVAVQGSSPKKATCGAIWDVRGRILKSRR